MLMKDPVMFATFDAGKGNSKVLKLWNCQNIGKEKGKDFQLKAKD